MHNRLAVPYDITKVIWLMTCEDGIVINALADFVFRCFEIRTCLN